MDFAELTERVKVSLEGQRAPVHVVRRLHLLLGGAEAMYVEGQATPAAPAMDGWVVAFTETRVVRVVFTQSQNPSSYSDLTFTATASAWPRHALGRVDISPDERSRVNSDAVWHEDLQDWWRDGAAIRLTYVTAGEVVTLSAEGWGADDQRRALLAFLPSLLADLDATSGGGAEPAHDADTP